MRPNFRGCQVQADVRQRTGGLASGGLAPSAPVLAHSQN
jgi:hypothetical protein